MGSNQQWVFGLIKSISGQANILTIPRIFIDITGGDIKAALFLSQCVYWSDRGGSGDGFFWKSYKEWNIEIGLTRPEIDRVRKSIDRFLETKIKKASGAPTTHYRVRMDILAREIEQKYSDLHETDNSDLHETDNSDLHETDKSLTETTPEITCNTGAKAPEPKSPPKPKLADVSALADLAVFRHEVRPLAAAFIKAAGEEYRPTNGEVSLWYKTLNTWRALQVSADEIAGAVQHLRNDDLSIKGPQSLTATIRDRRARVRVQETDMPVYRRE
jgi:hypothetical protein